VICGTKSQPRYLSKLRNRIQLGVNKRFQSPTVFPNHTQQFPVRSWSLRTRVPANNGEEEKWIEEEEEDSNPRSGSCGIEGKACWFRAEPVRDAVDKKTIRPLGQKTEKPRATRGLGPFKSHRKGMRIYPLKYLVFECIPSIIIRCCKKQTIRDSRSKGKGKLKTLWTIFFVAYSKPILRL